MKHKMTKIVATIADMNSQPDFLLSLHKAGMNVVRINTAHQPKDTFGQLVGRVRSASEHIAVLVDTKGPEIRLTHMDRNFDAADGDYLTVVGSPDENSSKERLCTNHPGFVAMMNVGQFILIDDGSIKLEVTEKHDAHLICKVIVGGKIKSRKGVNVPGVHVDLPSVSEKDKEFIRLAVEHKADFIAHSFVRDKEDVLALQAELDKHNSDIKIIAKIENEEGLDNVDDILDHVYGIMVARGDLGVEIPAEKIPGVQKKLIRKAIAKRKRVIIATQMLHSMITNPRPTRAEVTDVATAIYEGADAVMLSGETAYGKHPLEAVQTMTNIAHEVEEDKPPFDELSVKQIDNEVAAYLAQAAVSASTELPTKAIIVDTLGGRTPRFIAAHRGKDPIFAFCYDRVVMKRLALVYGVYPLFIEQCNSSSEFMNYASSYLLEQHHLEAKDLVLILAGSFGPNKGASFIEIVEIQNVSLMEKKSF